MTTDHSTHEAALTDDLDDRPNADPTTDTPMDRTGDTTTDPTTDRTDRAVDPSGDPTPDRTAGTDAGTDAGIDAGNGADPASRTATDSSGTDTASSPQTLIDPDRATAFQARWNELKGEFVDDPRHTVRRIDGLVGEVLDEVEQVFRKQRGELESGMADEGASTEDLRVAFGRYREFFDRLLTF